MDNVSAMRVFCNILFKHFPPKSQYILIFITVYFDFLTHEICFMFKTKNRHILIGDKQLKKGREEIHFNKGMFSAEG